MSIEKLIDCKSDDYEREYNPNHPNSSGWGYVFKHVLVMSEHLGRPLKKDEVVHHIDGNPKNNNLFNLQLLPRSEHSRMHMIGKKHGKKDMSNRRCLNCNSTSTYRNKDGYYLWYKKESGVLCNNCYKKSRKTNMLF